MKLLVKPFGTVYAVLKTDEQISNQKKLMSTEFFRFRQHGANVRQRELGSEYEVKHIKIKGGDNIKSIEAVLKTADCMILNKVSFYQELADAYQEVSKHFKKYPNAAVVDVVILTNLPGEENKSTT